MLDIADKTFDKMSRTENACLIFGDCFEVMKTLPDSCVDMIFADPPYNLSNGGFTCHAGKAVSVNKGKWDESRGADTDADFHRTWIRACRRLLKPNGTIWVSGTYHSIYACGTALQLEGYHILNDICWFKPNAPPNLSCRYFTASHETLIWARKKEKKSKHVYNYEAMKAWDSSGDKLKAHGKQMRSVWAISSPRKSKRVPEKHPTQKPLELLNRVIEASTNEGDLVFDPFMGGGTTGVSAITRNRNFIGVELEQEHFDLARNRIKDAEAEKESLD